MSSRAVSTPQLSDLVGRLSATSDAVVSRQRLRYLQSTVVNPGSYFRMVLSRLGPNSMIDARSLRMRCQIVVTSSDPNITIDPNQVMPMSRTRIISGATVCADVLEAHLLNSITYNSTATVTEALMERHVVGDDDLTQKLLNISATYYEVMFPIHPPNSFLRGKRLVDLSGGDMFLEFFVLQPQQYLFSPANDIAATFQLVNVEILSEYVTSPTIGNYFRTNPMAFTCWNWQWVTQTLSASVENFRMPSSSTSLNGFFIVMRDADVESSIQNQNKYTAFNSNNFQSWNLLVNQIPFTDEFITPYAQPWDFLKDFWPEAYNAKFYDLTYMSPTAGSFVTGVSIAALPSEFALSISSGVRTASLNNDLIFQWQFGAPLNTPQRCDAFLQSDVIISSQGPGRDLLIQY
jgi:hypothetical protein